MNAKSILNIGKFGTCAFLGAQLLGSKSASAAFSFTGTSGVVNIDASVSGISMANGAYAGSTLISPVQETFPAGTYTGSVTTPLLNAAALFTAWTYQDTTPLMPYLENFAAFNDNGGSPITAAPVINFQSPQFVFGVSPAGPLAAYALVAAQTFSFTLSVPTTLDFVVPDNFLSDNAGGVSVAITKTSATPEPVSMGLLGVGATVLLGRRNRRAVV